MTVVMRDLTGLISSRICHDLINPIGAISNGLELLEVEGRRRSPELDLVSESVSDATAKLSYYRLAFGDAGEGSELHAADMAKAIQDMFRAAKLNVTATLAPGAYPRRQAKLTLLVLLCVEASLPRGGEAALTFEHDAWIIRARGDGMNVNDGHWEAVSKGDIAAEFGSRQAEFAVAAASAAEYALSVMMTTDGREIVATIRPAPG